MKSTLSYFFLFISVAVACCSCQPSMKMHKDRLYLQGIDSSLATAVKAPELRIQKSDKLSIVFFSDDVQASSYYNLAQAGTGTTAGGDAVSAAAATAGYVVDESGNILISRLGAIHAEGLSKAQLRTLLLQRVDTLLLHPYIEIRFLNKRVTMLGEISRPGVLNIPEERLNIFDALALSGDLTLYGRKDNILVVREENGKRTMGRLNIKDPAVYKSPFFYLQKDDMVYVEPVRAKPTGTDQTLVRNISIAASLISVLAILYSVFKNN